MSRKATVFKLPEKYVIVKDGNVVGFGRSKYNSAEIAKAYGATKVEFGEWEDILKSGISPSLAGSLGKAGAKTSRQPKK